MIESVDTDRVNCAVCGDVIGIYEPAMLDLGDGVPLRTSLLAAGELPVGPAYHLDCAPQIED
jgi:peptide subunit release factor RF-3